MMLLQVTVKLFWRDPDDGIIATLYVYGELKEK